MLYFLSRDIIKNCENQILLFTLFLKILILNKNKTEKKKHLSLSFVTQANQITWFIYFLKLLWYKST